MKLAMKTAVAFLLTSLLWSPLQAQVIPDDAVISATPGSVFGDYDVSLTDSQAGFGLFSIGIEAQGDGDFQFGTSGIAEEYALFFADPGDAIGPEFVRSNPIFASNFDGSGLLNLNVGESVYFAYWDERNFVEGGSPFRVYPDSVDGDDNYGWFQLLRNVDGLEITGGATAIASGIFVGTTESFAIPEPSALMLLVASSLVASLRRVR